MRAYPTLLDRGDSVSLKVVDNEALQQRAMRGGVRRLLLMAAAPTPAKVERVLDDRMKLAIAGSGADLADLDRRLRRSCRRRGDGTSRTAVGRAGVRGARTRGARSDTAARRRRARRGGRHPGGGGAGAPAHGGAHRRRAADRPSHDAEAHVGAVGRAGLRAPQRRRPPARRAPLRPRHRVPARPPRR